ncbi:hypothetical protein JF50_00900 [Pseudoalteromonas luteoviolacea]|uniref:Uncharacterized protein n=1 Tax=Pseudoalteromonas luteoviolacea TaxID=43657 RepID=A0A0C1QEF5_9GAMM|nr:hypothetical protein [Pseudoalteromonas luteoviolacea]KID59046.1 hypothetical protein JF50_00900 [Pseudoalteromonas luteoviolacea]
MTSTSEQEILNAEQQATDAVAQSDIDTAAQSTGYATSTPFEAERVARDAVVAADQAVYNQACNPSSSPTPEQAEQIATQAVADTE